MLEAQLKADNNFVSLTYADEHLPISATGYPTLNRSHFTLWLKRLRKATPDLKLRYYGCGEYGDKTWRPHYHVIVFGLPACLRLKTQTDLYGRPEWNKCCPICKMLGDTWGLGDIYCGEVNTQTAAYCGGYVTKKMTSSQDERLLGRQPEFGAMSLKPGIGCDFMWEVASTLLQYDLEDRPDVPSELKHGGKAYPLGRYLKRQLRKMIGRDPKAPQSELDKIKAELQPLREAAFDASESFREKVIAEGAQKVLQKEVKLKIFKSRRQI